MKRKIPTALLLVISLVANVYSQSADCSCKDELTFLDGQIRKKAPFKANKKAYEAAYTIALKNTASAKSVFECQVLLNTLLISLNDNHSKVYSIDLGATKEVKANPDAYAAFKNGNIYNTYPKPSIDLDSLKSVLNTKPKTEIEGIYTIENYVTIGVYKTENENKYKAIVVSSETDLWAPGEIAYILILFGNEFFLTIGGSLSTKRLIAYTERVQNGFFYFMGFQKDIAQTNYASVLPSDSTYYRKELSDNTTYLRIGSFSSWYPKLSDAEKFYKSLEGNLIKSNLIIDLRNHGGGGDRNSDILYKLVKEYAKGNKVYVLINHKTVSNAEQFAYKLSELNNCLLFGTRTNGSLAYEIKDGSHTLPCGNFVAVLTSKKHAKYLPFESHGIKPDVQFDIGTDWIVQMKSFIANNN